MLEIWKEIPDYLGTYQVSNQGRVKNVKSGLILRTHENLLGYKFVRLSNKAVSKKYRVHRLVAKAFILNPEDKPFINHLDSNPRNNDVNNLAWCTQSENILYAYNHGNKKPTLNRLGSKSGKSSQYNNVHFCKIRERWCARVETTTPNGLDIKRKNFAISRFKSSNQAEREAALAVNTILDNMGDTIRPRNNVKRIKSGDILDVITTTTTD